MNRFQDDYDPYAVEEPSDEEPALSRWAPAPPRPLRLQALATCLRCACLACGDPRPSDSGAYRAPLWPMGRLGEF